MATTEQDAPSAGIVATSPDQMGFHTATRKRIPDTSGGTLSESSTTALTRSAGESRCCLLLVGWHGPRRHPAGLDHLWTAIQNNALALAQEVPTSKRARVDYWCHPRTPSARTDHHQACRRGQEPSLRQYFHLFCTDPGGERSLRRHFSRGVPHPSIFPAELLLARLRSSHGSA